MKLLEMQYRVLLILPVRPLSLPAQPTLETPPDHLEKPVVYLSWSEPTSETQFIELL